MGEGLVVVKLTFYFHKIQLDFAAITKRHFVRFFHLVVPSRLVLGLGPILDFGHASTRFIALFFLVLFSAKTSFVSGFVVLIVHLTGIAARIGLFGQTGVQRFILHHSLILFLVRIRVGLFIFLVVIQRLVGQLFLRRGLRPLVHLQMGAIRGKMSERLLADLALVRFLARMYAQMALERAVVAKKLIANLALIRLHARVYARV